MSSFSSKLLSPSVALLNRLTFTWKFALIFALYLIPISYFALVSLSEHNKTIDKVVLERQGLKYMSHLRPLLEHLAESRGVTYSYLSGKSQLKSKIVSAQSMVNNDLDNLNKIDNVLGNTLQTSNLVKTIQTDWQDLVKNVLGLKSHKAFSQHSAILTKLLSLNAHLLESSELLLDPSLDSNFMANALSLRIPVLVELISQSTGLGAGIITSGSFTPESYVQLNTYTQNITIANSAMMHGFDVVFENNPAVSELLSDMRNTVEKSTLKFVSLIKNNVLQPEKFKIDSEKYFIQGTETIKLNLELYDNVMQILDSILESRISTMKTNILINIVASLGLLFAALYIFGGFKNSLMYSIDQIKKSVHAMANGDLTTKVKLEARDEMKLISHDMNLMIDKINDLITQVINCTNQVVISSEQSGSASKDTLDGVNQQNQELELIATAMNEMSATVHEVANNAASTTEATRNADQESNNGRTVVNQTIKSINALSSEMQQASNVIKQVEQDSESIGSVLDVIRGIAEQTNLLALNAAIEAARAGEQGRGFAVVADEVRTLASRTQDSTQEIQTMIEKLQLGARNAVTVMDDGTQQTEKTVAHAAEAGTTLETITAAVDHINSMNEQIASAAEQQSSVAQEINKNVVNVRDIAEHTVTHANKTAESSEMLKGVAAQLQSLITEFKVS